MKTGGAARAVDHGCFQVVENDGARAGPEELQGVRQAAIEFRLALGEGELDVGHPAIAEHGHQYRDLAGRVADGNAAALTPIDLHRLGRLIVDFLINATARGEWTARGGGR